MNNACFFGLFALLSVGAINGCAADDESSNNNKNALGAQESVDGGDGGTSDGGPSDGSTGSCTPVPAPNLGPPGAPGGANPASVYCTALGYELDLATGACTFPDGSTCDEWDFWRGTCGGAHSFCNLHGGTVSAKVEDMGGWTASYALCTLPNGATCKDSDFAASCKCD
jgi:putative hemolysin